MERFVKIFRIYEVRDIENSFAFIEDKPCPYPNNPNTNTLWFIGLKLWGKNFASKDAELRDANIKISKG